MIVSLDMCTLIRAWMRFLGQHKPALNHLPHCWQVSQVSTEPNLAITWPWLAVNKSSKSSFDWLHFYISWVSIWVFGVRVSKPSPPRVLWHLKQTVRVTEVKHRPIAGIFHLCRCKCGAWGWVCDRFTMIYTIEAEFGFRVLSIMN
jgi:hypothetical protein